MANGEVKWFSKQKGYGFIPINDRKDSFAPFSAIQTEGFKTLGKGQEVDFKISKGSKRRQAANVTGT